MTDANVQQVQAIVSRKEAIASGAAYYFTGKPCKHGHISKRNVHRACISCVATNGRANGASYYKRNADAINEKLRAAYANDPAVVAAERKRKLKYNSANREKINARAREYRKENPGKGRERRREYKANKRKSDPVFLLAARMQAAIGRAIRVGGYTKRARTYEYLGCTYEEFKLHIERQFTNGMHWENRDKWHIDHIIPQSTAKTEDELLALQHYTNLRPLWADANKAKGNRQEFLI